MAPSNIAEVASAREIENGKLLCKRSKFAASPH